MKETAALPMPVATDVMVGAPGGATGLPVAGPDAAPAPIALTARTCTEYDVPFTRPVTVIGEVAVPAEIQFPSPFTWYW